MGGDGLDLESFEVAGVEVVLFPEVGSEEVVVVGDHELVDLREADVQSAVVHHLRGEVLEVVLDLVVGPEVVGLVEAVEPLRVDLVKLLALLQFLDLPCLYDADDLLVLVLPGQFPGDLVHEVLPKLLPRDAVVAHVLDDH